MTDGTFAVEGMTCSHCQGAVAKALRGVPGVTDVAVDLGRHQASVRYDAGKVTVEQLAKAVEDAGYTLAKA